MIGEIISEVINNDNIFYILKKIYTKLENIINYKNSHINKKIKDLDIQAKIEEIEGLFIDISNDCILKNKISIKKSIDSIVQVISKIHTILDDISNKINEHQNKWFSYWRSVDFSDEIQELETNEKLLAVRYSRVKDLLRVNWH